MSQRARNASPPWWKPWALARHARLLEERLALLEGEYQTLTSSIAASIIIRTQTQKTTFCSPYTEVMSGYAVREFLNHPGDLLLESVHPNDRDRYQRAFQVVSLGELYKFRYRVKHKSGFDVWLETHLVPLLSATGEVSGSIGISLDVTDSVRYQQSIEERNVDLHDFTSMVSHDLKAPVFTIRGMAQILQEELGSGAQGETREALAHLQQASDRLAQLVTGIMEYSEVSALESTNERIPLQNVLLDISTDYARQLSALNAELALPARAPIVLGDRTKLYQIFANLISNALKYHAPNRPLRISVEILSHTPREVIVALRDTGRGIPAEKLSQVFRPFFRAHPDVTDGSGIGLACVRKLVDKVGGQIRVESDERSGTTFFITLRVPPGEMA